MDNTALSQMANTLQNTTQPVASTVAATAQEQVASCDKKIRDRGRYGIAIGAVAGTAAAYGAYKKTGHWGWGIAGWLIGCGVGTAVNAMLPEPACVADVAPLRQ